MEDRTRDEIAQSQDPTKTEGGADACTDDEMHSSVGYKRPPVHTRYTKGRSGNPKGRPKGSRILSTLLKEVFAETVSVSKAGKVKRISKAEALIEVNLNRAVKGDTKALSGIIALAETTGLLDEQRDNEKPKYGVLVVPGMATSREEWERLSGPAARGESQVKVTRPASVEGADALVARAMQQEALAGYRYLLAIFKERLAGDGSDTQAQKDLRMANGRIASISFAFVQRGHFSLALQCVDEAISLLDDDRTRTPDIISAVRMWFTLYRAHALMFFGREDKARSLYLQHRGKTLKGHVRGDMTWETAVLDNFSVLRNVGRNHPLMDEIEGSFRHSRTKSRTAT